MQILYHCIIVCAIQILRLRCHARVNKNPKACGVFCFVRAHPRRVILFRRGFYFTKRRSAHDICTLHAYVLLLSIFTYILGVAATCSARPCSRCISAIHRTAIADWGPKLGISFIKPKNDTGSCTWTSVPLACTS